MEIMHSIIDSHSIPDVLFLYNVDTFLGDNSIADVLIQEEPEEDTEALEESQEGGGADGNEYITGQSCP